MDGSFQAAMTCAAMLMGYSDALPAVEVENRAPTQEECDDAIARSPERKWFHQQYGPRPACFALTYYLNESWGAFPKHWAKVVVPADAAFAIKVTEALRVLNYHRGGALTSEQIYNLRDRSDECGVAPAAGPTQVAGG